VAFWACAGLSCLLFVIQSVLWTAMRMRKISVARWTVWARRIRLVGCLLLAIGAILWIGDGNARTAALFAIFGGGMNALVASFHLAVVSYLSRPPRSK